MKTIATQKLKFQLMESLKTKLGHGEGIDVPEFVPQFLHAIAETDLKEVGFAMIESTMVAYAERALREMSDDTLSRQQQEFEPLMQQVIDANPSLPVVLGVPKG